MILSLTQGIYTGVPNMKYNVYEQCVLNRRNVYQKLSLSRILYHTFIETLYTLIPAKFQNKKKLKKYFFFISHIPALRHGLCIFISC